MRFLTMLVLLFSLFSTWVSAQELKLGWPREIATEKYLVTIYQPQLESFEANILQGRMAIAIKPADAEMVFCAAWFVAKMDTDLDKKTVVLNSIEITNIHFPDVSDNDMIARLTELLETQISAWNLTMSLNRLTASLGDIHTGKSQSDKLNNAPPEIYYRSTPTVLVTIDGDPILKKIENSDMVYVVNTPFFIVGFEEKREYYLYGGELWYRSDKIADGWAEVKDIPEAVRKFAEQNSPKDGPELPADAKGQPPTILVVSKPSEIILTDGKPEYQSVEGSSLLYVMNSESEIIMDVKSQYHYVSMAGRWYRSKTLQDGDWKFVEPDNLPEAFATIPEKSPMATVRASIPGTPEAQDALLEQSVPQTATVDRKTATVQVSFDGEPQFKKIEGTEVSYCINCDKTVLKISGKYYCVDDGIWFVAETPAGPWAVSDTRPDEVDDLPPDSPVYNVKYVYVYDSTPDVVYVGYYPGYYHSYVYGGVVVYGTGYWYRPWYHHYYYPRPCTWGFGVHWNSHTGWGFSFGFSYGWVGWGFHPYHRPYWGPRGYYRGYRHGYDDGFRHGARAGYRAAKWGSERPVQYNTLNVYNNRKTGIIKTRDIHKGNLKDRVGTVSRPSTKPNDIFSDKKGNIYQRKGDGNWREKTTGKKQLPAGRPEIDKSKLKNTIEKKPQTRDIPRQQLNRSHQNRVRGDQRVNRSRGGGTGRARPMGRRG